jgi:hydrogenase maturation protein HypF
MAAMNGINPFAEPYEIPLIQEDGFIIRTDALTKYIVELVQEGRDAESIAYLFHLAIAKTTENVVASIAREQNIHTVVLSGGVFQNRLLLSMVREFLEKNGLQVYLPRRIPVNDGCIAMGQIAVAKEMVENGKV